jgi:methionyl-tRNA formyltransferase
VSSAGGTNGGGSGSGLVMLAGAGEPTNILYHALARDFVFDRVVIEQPVPRAEFLRRRARKLGWPTVTGQVAFQAGLVPLLRRAARARRDELITQHGFDASPIDPSRVTHVASANAPETHALLRELAPRVVLVSGTRILSRDTLAAAPAPARFVNVHAGITPLYRGVHGGYWALVDRRPDACGVTVHLVDEGIDTGAILGQALIAPTARDCFVTYHYLQLAAALPLLRAALRDLRDGRVRTVAPPAGASTLRSHPTLWQYVWHRARAGVR